MTWHVVGNAQGIHRHRRGVWLSVEAKVDRVKEVEYRRTIIHVAIYQDAADMIGLAARERVVLEVGADHDVGCLRVRRAVDGENGLVVRQRSHAVLDIARAMTGFPLPAIKPRRAVRATRVRRDGDALAIVLPGEMTRDLKAAQTAALEKERGVA